MWEDRETEPRDYLIPCKCGKGRFKKLGYNTYNTCLRNKAIPKIYLEKDDSMKDIYPNEEIYRVRNFAEGVITGNDYKRGDFEFEYQEGIVEIRGSGNSWDGEYYTYGGGGYREMYALGSSPEEVANKILGNYDKALGVKEGETKYD